MTLDLHNYGTSMDELHDLAGNPPLNRKLAWIAALALVTNTDGEPVTLVRIQYADGRTVEFS